MTTNIKKAHNISKNISKKEFMEISTNNVSDKNDKIIEVDNPEVKQKRRRKKVGNEKNLKLYLA